MNIDDLRKKMAKTYEELGEVLIRIDQILREFKREDEKNDR